MRRLIDMNLETGKKYLIKKVPNEDKFFMFNTAGYEVYFEPGVYENYIYFNYLDKDMDDDNGNYKFSCPKFFDILAVLHIVDSFPNTLELVKYLLKICKLEYSNVKYIYSVKNGYEHESCKETESDESCC